MENRRSLPPYEDELSLALLRSADHDEPSAGAYSKVAATLGVSAAVGLGASLPVAALASSGASASNALRWSGSLFAKGVVVAVSSVLLVAAGVALHRARGPAAPSTQRPALGEKVARAPASAAPPVVALARDVSAPTPPPTPTPSPTPPGIASAVLSPASAVMSAAARPLKLAQNAHVVLGPSAPRAPQKSSLPEQVLSLDRARVALSSGDPAAALSEIAHYRSTWPHGVFLTEASVLEIEALAKRGEIVLAGMRAQAFVTAHPDSPQAERLRALIPRRAR